VHIHVWFDYLQNDLVLIPDLFDKKQGLSGSRRSNASRNTPSTRPKNQNWNRDRIIFVTRSRIFSTLVTHRPHRNLSVIIDLLLRQMMRENAKDPEQISRGSTSHHRIDQLLDPLLPGSKRKHFVDLVADRYFRASFMFPKNIFDRLEFSRDHHRKSKLVTDSILCRAYPWLLCVSRLTLSMTLRFLNSSPRR